MSDVVGEAVRDQGRRERLGEEAACAICGFSDRRALVPADVHVVEKDHVYGRQRDPVTTIALCRNHHAVLTESRRDAGVPMKPGPDALEESAMMTRSLGLALKQLGESQLAKADHDLGLRDHLLDKHPEVRETLKEHPSTYQMGEDYDD